MRDFIEQLIISKVLFRIIIWSGLCLQELINKAIEASVAARREWDLKPVADRAQIFLKAADIISGPERADVLAKTMIGQVRVHKHLATPRSETFAHLEAVV